MHRKPPLADERRTWRLVRNLVRLRPLNGEAAKFLRRHAAPDHDIVHDRHVQTVHLWDRTIACLSRSPAPYESADQRRHETRTSCTYQSTSRQARGSGRAVTGAEQHVRLPRVLDLAWHRADCCWCRA
jgi:hypothetical protein